ncbi:uncharacterized protein LOC106637347 [Copidosoma floridanum]|uniref:uncharacterized protein LOC106637347 n=1 Tax=Copidosoma floridanum TaxID=29053 RepID=UPI0006C94EAB|nr:uncharacterized protein LOC106637347 [Copidosoma floridanum]
MSDTMFDTLMEIRKVNKEITEQKEKLQQNHKKLIALEENISNVKQLQLKAQSVLINTEMKSKVIDTELKEIHKSYDKLFEYWNEHVKVGQENISNDTTRNVDMLRKQRDELREKVAKAKEAKEDVARQLNDIEMQINIQKKKSAATLLRLQKNLEELLQEETNLINKLH